MVASSKDVSLYFDKRHDLVLRDIDNLIAQLPPGGVLKFEETSYVHRQNGQTYRAYDMTRDGFMLLAMGFTGAKALTFKLAYIDEFNAMEEALKAPPPVSTEMAQLAATVAQMAVTIADIQKSITRLLPAPTKKDDRKERLDELKPSRV